MHIIITGVAGLTDVTTCTLVCTRKYIHTQQLCKLRPYRLCTSTYIHTHWMRSEEIWWTTRSWIFRW